MPTPGSSYFTPNVAPSSAPVPHVGQVSPSAFGADLAESVGRAALVAGGIQDRAQDDHWAGVVLDYDNQLAAWESEATKAALATRGKDAAGITAQRLAEFDRLVRDQSQDITHPQARERFEWVASRRRAAIENHFGNHERQQSEIHLRDSATARQQLAASAAADHWDDPLRLSIEWARGMEGVQLATRGMSPEAQKAAVQRFGDVFHGQVIDTLLANGHASYAAEYAAKHPDEMTAAGKQDVEKALRPARLNEAAAAHETRIVGEGGSYQDWLTKARAIGDVEERDATLRRLDYRASQDARAREKYHSDLYDVADAAFRKHFRYAEIPPVAEAELTANERAHYRRLEFQENERRAGKWTELSIDTMSDDALEDWAAYLAKPLEERVNEKILVQFEGRVPRTMLASELNVQRTHRDALAHAEDVASIKALATAKDIDAILRDRAIRNSLLPARGDALPKQRRDYTKLHAYVRDRIAGLDHDPTKAELEQIADEAVTDVVVNGWFSDSTKKRFAVLATDEVAGQAPPAAPASAAPTSQPAGATPGPSFPAGPVGAGPATPLAPSAVDIPPADRAQVIEALRAMGQPVDEQSIRELWERVRTR